MAWYNPMSWGDKVVDNVLDKDNGLISQVGSWIGGLKLTDEEVMEQNAKTVSSVQQFVKDSLSESTERSKSRRSFVNVWLKMHVGVILMGCISAPWNLELAKLYFDLSMSPMIAGITGAISIFFFGSHGLARFNETKK